MRWVPVAIVLVAVSAPSACRESGRRFDLSLAMLVENSERIGKLIDGSEAAFAARPV
jgi:hypothetical protein